MSDNEAEHIAELVAQKMSERPARCQVFSDDEIIAMREFFQALSKTKSIALTTLVGAIVIGLFGLLIGGIGAWVLKIFKGV